MFHEEAKGRCPILDAHVRVCVCTCASEKGVSVTELTGVSSASVINEDITKVSISTLRDLFWEAISLQS